MAVKIDFYPVLEDNYTLVFEDTTKLENPQSYEIDTMEFTLTSPYLPNTTYTADAINFYYTQKQDKEWYRVTSGQLGLAETQWIPDGVYEASFKVNNQYTTTHKFMVFQDFETKTNALLNNAGYSVDTDETNLLYQNATKYDFETYSILYSLLAQLKQFMLDGDVTAAEEALVKGTRILQTIETTGFDII